MTNTRQTSPRTRLEAFLVAAPFSLGKLARAADMPHGTLDAIRTGRSTPKADTIERLRRAASELAGREIDVREMFEFGDPPNVPAGTPASA
jgi:hypothetical protein